MTRRVKPAAVKKRISTDLISLCRVLRENVSDVVLNPEVLLASANDCKGDPGGGDTWGYEVAELRFQVSTPQNVLPKTDKKLMFITININLKGVCNEDVEDCLTDLVFNIHVETEDKQNLCSWHFDRHISSEEDADSQEAHPLYHFQHGGHAMKGIAESLGRVLLLPAPRLASPPMDAVLAIDFLLSNFAGKSWRNLRDNPTYLTLLKDAQRRHWKPYVDRLANWWISGTRADQSKTLALWPHLI